MIKNILLFILLMPFGLELVADRDADKEADEDRFGNKHDWCAEKNYGHHAIVVDTTEKFNENQYELLSNQILNDSSIGKIPPYDRVTILDLTGRDVTATQTKPIFSKCRPRSGEKTSEYKLDQPSFWMPKEKMQQKMNFFNLELAEARAHFSELGELSGEYSMIMELIKEISRVDEIKYTDSDSYDTRKLVIFSDLLQNSKNVGLIRSCRDKKKCVTWEGFKNDPKNKMKLKKLMPDFDNQKKPEVFVYYLQCKFDKNLNIGLLEFWDGYFTEAGIKWDYDIETACI